MALPNPTMDAVPFTPLTAEFLDNMIENIESLATGTGLDDNAITTTKINTSAITSSKLAPTKSADAASWTVYDLGTFKMYGKSVSVSGTVPAMGRNTGVVVTPPTGVVWGSLRVTHVYKGAFTGHIFSGMEGSGSDMLMYLGSAYSGGTLTATGVIEVVAITV